MNKIIPISLLFLLTACNNAESLDVNRLIPALSKVESNNNSLATGDNGRAFGKLQIWQLVIDDVNKITGSKYKHSDAFNPVKANEICKIYLSYYCTEKRLGHKPTMEDGARIWNGGPNGYKKDSTISYWNKVKAELK